MTLQMLLLALPMLLGSAAAPRDAEALERGLANIEIGELRADLNFFADRALRGRSSPSKAQRIAARFLRSRLMRLGLQPAGEWNQEHAQRSWFQGFDIYQRGLDQRNSRMTLKAGEATRSLGLGKDYFVANFEQVRNFELEGQVVYCGAAGSKELEGLDLDGRWALCLYGNRPDPKRDAALGKRGVLGVLVMGDPGRPGDPIGRQLPRTQRAKTVARIFDEEPDELPAFLPLAHLRRSAAASLLAMAGLAKDQLPSLGQTLALTLAEKRSGSGLARVENVCALWPGSDPKLKHEVILLSAHYDHLAPSGARIYQGADDNASGSMALLALAQALVDYGSPRRSVMLLWSTCEEQGLRGSEAFAKDPTLPEGMRVICNINMDMLGRNAGDALSLSPSPKHECFGALSALTHELAPLEGFAKLDSADDYWKRGDHYNFSTTMGLPVVFLFSGLHGDYHTHMDTPDKVNFDKLRRATRLVLRLVDRLQVDPLKL